MKLLIIAFLWLTLASAAFAQNTGLGPGSSTQRDRDSTGLSTVKDHCKPAGQKKPSAKSNEEVDCTDPGTGDASGVKPQTGGMSPPQPDRSRRQ